VDTGAVVERVYKNPSEEDAMAAYVIVDVDVVDKTGYEAYKAAAPSSISAFGGRYVARGGRAETLEGTWKPARLVVLEFPSYEQAKAWWASESYEPAKRMRHATARTQMVVVEGT
jgi:uncharacterized protein (DUF1330 family)